MIPLSIFSNFFQTGNITLQIVLIVLFIAYVTYIGASRLEIKVIRASAIVILLAGIGLYFYAYSLEDYAEGPFTIFLRSTLSSIEMFVSQNDLIEIERAQEKPLFLDIFIFVYSCAVVTSISALLSLFAKRVMTKVTMKVLSRRNRKFRHIFFGLDQNSVSLAKNLDKEERIAFLEFPSDEEARKISLGSIVQNVFQGIVVKNGLDEDKVTILKAKRNIEELIPGQDLLKQMGLARLKKLADDSTCFYILSDNAEKNVSDVMTLVTDEFFRSHTIQCHAYKTGLIRQYERSLFDTHVHFFYPDTMSVLALREDIAYHPVNTVDIAMGADGKSLGYVNGDSFKAMIFGFGESGKEILKFIFKYASFIGADGNPLPVTCYVQDPEMAKLSGTFKASTPALKYGSEIVFETVDYLSEDFWDKLKGRLDGLNYIVFSSNDGEKNLNAATHIVDYAIKHRKGGIGNLKILAHIVDSSDCTRSICDFYNLKAGCQCILTYGDRKELFSPQWLVSGNSIGVSSYSTSHAEAMYLSYFKGLEMEAPSWHQRNEMCEKAREERNFKTFLQLVRFLRQYIDSALYSSTIALLGKGHEDILTTIPVDLAEFNKLPSKTRAFIDKIASTTHLCWYRQMTVSGYVYADKSADIEKKNEYLLPWDKLSDAGKHQFRMQAKGMFIYQSEISGQKDNEN